MNNKELGNFGETQACWLLKEKGYRILERNWRCPVGEIDIVARRGSMVVFVEVKTRRSLTYGVPREAVTSKKQQRIRKAAWYYIASHHLKTYDMRCDVIEIFINHLESAF